MTCMIKTCASNTPVMYRVPMFSLGIVLLGLALFSFYFPLTRTCILIARYVILPFNVDSSSCM